MRTIIHSLIYSLDFLEQQMADLTSDQLTAQPAGILNHPSWTIGHLTHVLQMIGGVVGVPGDLPADWPGRYGSGSKPVSDPRKYENREVAVRMLRASRDRIVDALEGLDDATLDQPFPDPAYLDVFPTIRHALIQVLVGHTAFHVGQVSVWRRAMGLPPMDRSYE